MSEGKVTDQDKLALGVARLPSEVDTYIEGSPA